MVKYYTLNENKKLISLDALPISGDYRVLQQTNRGGLFIPNIYQEKVADFLIMRRSAQVAPIVMPTLTLETTPFSITGVGSSSCMLLVALYENVDHLGIRLAIGTDWNHRIEKTYSLTTGQVEAVDKYNQNLVVYSIKQIQLNGLHRIMRFQYEGSQTYIYISKAQSGIDNPVYSYNLHTVASGTYDDDYYDVDADIIYSLGGASSDSDIAQHAMTVAEQSRQIANGAKATANAAMNAINLANLDDKISV